VLSSGIPFQLRKGLVGVMNCETTAVSFDLCMGAIGKSGRVLYAFTEFYLYFYGIEAAFLFNHFSIFGCISAAIYCVDESVEQGLSPRRGVGVDDLEELLAKRIEVDDHVLSLLRDAQDYCAFEQAARTGRAVFDLQVVLRISKIRSVDFRLMHHALLQIAEIPYDTEVFQWFRAFEVLMEIEDDLSSIKEDERKGGYNYYCFARKVAGRNVGHIVETVRMDLEQQLKAIGASLHHRGFIRCADVIERYRRIVPRRPVPVEI
jgi:hypothetical protein